MFPKGCFTGSGAITWLPQCQWNNIEGYGQNQLWLIAIKHNKVQSAFVLLSTYSLHVKLCYMLIRSGDGFIVSTYPTIDLPGICCSTSENDRLHIHLSEVGVKQYMCIYDCVECYQSTCYWRCHNIYVLSIATKICHWCSFYYMCPTFNLGSTGELWIVESKVMKLILILNYVEYDRQALICFKVELSRNFATWIPF